MSDIPEFDERIKPIQDDIQAGVNAFREVQQMYSSEKLNKDPKRMPFTQKQNSGKLVQVIMTLLKID